MIGLRSRIGFAVFLYMVVLMGAVMGVNQGYQAQTVENTSIVYEQGTVTIGDSQTELNTSVGENATIANGIEGTVQRGIFDFVEELLHVSFIMAFGVADYAATIAFYISPIVPKATVSGALNVASVIPVAVLGYVGLQRVAEIA